MPTTKHGKSKSKLYALWISMRRRCNNEQCDEYKNYGGKGIKVYKEWNNNFEPFEKWALDNGYTEGLIIDRVDKAKNYVPNNCRIAPKNEHARFNRAKEVLCVETGVVYESLLKVSRTTGKTKSTLVRAIERGNKCAGYTWKLL
jgi:hypothetical protein